MKQDIVIDACSLLNLYAAGGMLSALSGCGSRILLLPQVAAETLFIYRGGDGPGAKDRIEVDLIGLIAEGVLVPDSLKTPLEQEVFVELSGLLDDGEAACCAVAMTRGIPLLTDDGRARTFMIARGHSELVTTTPDTIKALVEALKMEPHDVRRILVDIEERAHFSPPKSHPLRSWWSNITGVGQRGF